MPFALKTKLEAELDRLESEGIIEESNFSEWASPVVPVLKANGSLRICGDSKSTFNEIAVVDQYPIPKVEDLLAVMSSGQTWSKFDLMAAYQQLELEEGSKDYNAISMHRGLCCYNRMPYGISSAPVIFQKFMESTLTSIPFVVAHLGDILVSDRNQEDHLVHLSEVFHRL